MMLRTRLPRLLPAAFECASNSVRVPYIRSDSVPAGSASVSDRVSAKITPDAGTYDIETLQSIPRTAALPIARIHNADGLSTKLVKFELHQALTGVSLEQCATLTNTNIQWLALSRLTYVNLNNNPQLTSEGLRVLRMLPALEQLDLTGCHGLGESAFEHIAELPHLHTLDVSGSTSVTDQALLRLAKSKSLRHIRLADCRNISDFGVRELLRKGGLASLDLARNPTLRGQSFDALHINRDLLSLNMAGCSSFRGEHLAFVRSLPRLAHLDVSGLRQASAAQIQSLGTCTSLQRLSLAHSYTVNGDALKALAALQHLAHLNLSNCPLVDDIAVGHIHKFAGLTHLALRNCAIGNEGLRALKKASTLEFLDLAGCSLGPFGIKMHLNAMPNLEVLLVRDAGRLRARAPRARDVFE